MNTIFNFDNIGSKIKNFVKWSCWITIALISTATLISFFILLSDDRTAELCWIPIVVAIFSPIFVWIGSWVLYAFGELVEDIHAMRKKYYPIAEEQADYEAEEKAKREAEKKAHREAKEKAKFQAEEKAEQWKNAVERFEQDYGTCSNCGAKKKSLIYAEYIDYFGTTKGNVCFKCFCSKDCKPISKVTVEKTEEQQGDHSLKATQWESAQESFGTVYDICSNCGGNKQNLIFAEYSDCFGTTKGNVCFKCFCSKDCKPIPKK